MRADVKQRYIKKENGTSKPRTNENSEVCEHVPHSPATATQATKARTQKKPSPASPDLALMYKAARKTDTTNMTVS